MPRATAGPAASDPASTQPGRRVLVRPITTGEHTVFARARAAGFRQTPAWARVQPGGRYQSIGWFTAGELVGAALVVFRPVPGTRRHLAHVPEGPILPWGTVSAEPARWLDPFVAHLREAGAFAVRIGPNVPIRRWAALNRDTDLTEVTPTEQFADGGPLLDSLGDAGWRPGRAAYGVRLDLFRTLPDLVAGTDATWRADLAQAEREEVVVREGSSDDLLRFHRLHLATAARPQPEDYFRRLKSALEPRLYIASLKDGETAAAGVLVVQTGDVCRVAYVASSSRAAATAALWRAITEAHARGCRAFELPGVGERGAGGEVVQTAGEWDYSLSPLWYKAFRLYDAA